MRYRDNEALDEEKRRIGDDRRALRDRQDRARRRLRDAEKVDTTKRGEQIRDHNAIVKALVPRITGAIDSWAGKRVPVKVSHPSFGFSASTDFRSIDIHIPEQDVDVDFAADLRGLAYHEAGHILKSVPLQALLDQVMPHDETALRGSTDAQRYHNRENANTQREAILSAVLGVPFETIHQSWNMLEDQRMETAMVVESKNLGRYYNVIVLDFVVGNGAPPEVYLLLYGRRHVSKDVRDACRIACTAAYGLPLVVEAERIIDTYKAATTADVMWACVADFVKLIQQIEGSGGGGGLSSVDDHNEPTRDYYSRDYPEPYDAKEAEERVESGATEPGDEAEGSGGEEGDEDEDETDEGEGQGRGKGRKSKGEQDASDDDDTVEGGDTADRQAQPTGQRGSRGASKSTNAPDWSRKLVKDALKAAKEARNADGVLTHDVKAYNDALHDGGLTAQRVPLSRDPDPATNAEAARLNQQIRRIMEQCRAQVAPAWQVQQRRGVLDVRSYITRQPGDMEYYKAYTDDGDMRLPDMAVSVVLDGSGSMLGLQRELAVAAFAMKSACDVVGVPCTVTVYDTDVWMVWDADDRPLEVPYAIAPGGGTDPKRALDLIDLQKHDKANHLVVIMTDGAWSGHWYRGGGSLSLNHYAAPDRDLVIFYYGGARSDINGHTVCSMEEEIDDLTDLPRFLQRYLVKAM